MYVNNVASAYRLWVNGEPLDGNGTVGANAAEMKPRTYPRAYVFVPRSGDNELVLQVSNFSQRTGGIWEGIELGDAESIAGLQRNRIAVWAFLIGCLLLMSAFSVLLCLLRRQESSALWFGLICLAIGIRSSLLGESYVYALLPGLSWEWGVKLEYLSEIVTLLSLAAFVNKQYPQEAIRRFLPVSAFGLAGFGAFVLAAPAKTYTPFMVPYVVALLLPVFCYVLYVYLRAALRRRSGSRTNAIGFVVFFASVVHEVLYYTGFVPFGGLVPFGLLFFLVTQLLNLSLLFTTAMTRSEKLSDELRRTIESQEDTIRRRTSSLEALNRKLEQGNRELTRIEDIRSSLLAEVRHDLSTPVTAIKGFSKAIRSGVIPAEEAPAYAGRIYERSLLLEKLIDDVVELSQLRTGESKFEWAVVPLLPLLREWRDRYAAETDAKGIRLILDETGLPGQTAFPTLPTVPAPSSPPALAMESIAAMLDRYRFERVFSNLISNAVKHTPPGGLIRIWAEFRPTGEPERNEGSANAEAAEASDAPQDSGLFVLHVTDTGTGIPEDELSRIFERRYRVAGGPQAESGSGLGLAICREIVARHRGEISVRSRVGEGSDFYVAIPASTGAAAGNDETAEEAMYS
ncbi:sensor histidine kinase [Cohnella fermenti]|uniref:histidine kinase n=1 Tax=Cohnella fermenti TaxID=2565925 RepID=A0A4S4BRC1_9BACL|nr:sensor histidine kinase [Cohnella fermenti]THF77518.1 histidine kinase [Cohnella fermenti]